MKLKLILTIIALRFSSKCTKNQTWRYICADGDGEYNKSEVI